MVTQGFLVNRRSIIANRCSDTVTVTFKGFGLVALVIDRNEWLRLPLSVDNLELPEENEGSWDSQMLIGVPDFLPVPGRPAYVMYEATLLLSEDARVAVFAEIDRLHQDMEDENEWKTYLKIRCDTLLGRIGYATRRGWSKNQISKMQVSLEILQSYRE